MTSIFNRIYSNISTFVLLMKANITQKMYFKIIKCPLMRKGWTLNFFGLFLTRNPEQITPRIINHELIHTAQMRELFWIPFYIVYALEWIGRFVCCGNAGKAYRTISFEKEAYKNDQKPNYLSSRIPFNQWRTDKGRIK